MAIDQAKSRSKRPSLTANVRVNNTLDSSESTSFLFQQSPTQHDPQTRDNYPKHDAGGEMDRILEEPLHRSSHDMVNFEDLS